LSCRTKHAIGAFLHQGDEDAAVVLENRIVTFPVGPGDQLLGLLDIQPADRKRFNQRQRDGSVFTDRDGETDCRWQVASFFRHLDRRRFVEFTENAFDEHAEHVFAVEQIKFRFGLTQPRDIDVDLVCLGLRQKLSRHTFGRNRVDRREDGGASRQCQAAEQGGTTKDSAGVGCVFNLGLMLQHGQGNLQIAFVR